MLNKPKFLQPSTNLTECVIDIDADEVMFSCVVDGNESINAWQIKIYKLNDNETSVLDTEKQTLSSPFFPIDEKNRNVIFTQDIKPFLTNNDSFINSTEPYYWTMKFWGTSNTTTESCEEVFFANSTPCVEIGYSKEYSTDDSDYTILSDDATENIFDSRKYYFKATYVQEEDIQLKRYGWRIKDVDSDRILVDTITKKQVYGTSDNIMCSYDGFLNDGNYSIEVYVETQNGCAVKTEPKEFSVSYPTTFLTNDFKVETLGKEPAIILDWNKAAVIAGRSDRDGQEIYKQYYPIVDFNADTPNTSIDIPFGSYVTFDYGSSSNLDIEEGCYIVLSTQLPSNSEATLFVAEGYTEDGVSIMRRLSFDGESFVYTAIMGDYISTAEHQVTHQPSEYVWYVIVMSPMLEVDDNVYEAQLSVTESCALNGLYPSSILYPSQDTIPTFGEWDVLKEGE